MAEALSDNAIQPATRAAWRRWLERNHTRDKRVWFVYFKKSSGKQRFTYDDMVEEALCFGWIDGQARAVDDERSMLGPTVCGEDETTLPRDHRGRRHTGCSRPPRRCAAADSAGEPQESPAWPTEAKRPAGS